MARYWLYVKSIPICVFRDQGGKTRGRTLTIGVTVAFMHYKLSIQPVQLIRLEMCKPMLVLGAKVFLSGHCWDSVIAEIMSFIKTFPFNISTV